MLTTLDSNQWLNKKFPWLKRKGDVELIMTKLLSDDEQVEF